jgi:hypothetical protein
LRQRQFGCPHSRARLTGYPFIILGFTRIALNTRLSGIFPAFLPFMESPFYDLLLTIHIVTKKIKLSSFFTKFFRVYPSFLPPFTDRLRPKSVHLILKMAKIG